MAKGAFSLDVKKVYQQLTGVDIDQQSRLWDERGKGYYGEYLVFCHLYQHIAGNGKILMNLQIPTANGKSTEVDLVLIHETGIYVFEIKHYKGTIYGKDTDSAWTQYFRTTQNHSFQNPFIQNAYHIDALRKLFPQLPIYSCVVFTNPECDIRVLHTNPNVDICALPYMLSVLSNRFANACQCISMEQIDAAFSQLSVYSQMQAPVTINAQETSFLAWIQPTINSLTEKRQELEQERQSLLFQREKAKKIRRTSVLVSVLATICAVAMLAFVAFGIVHKYQLDADRLVQESAAELNQMKNNFLHIDQIDNEYIDTLHSYVEVSNESILPLTDDAVSFSARVAMKNDTYGIAFTEKSKYIVHTTAGKVYEYDVFGEHLKYSRFANMIGKGIRSYGDLKAVQFYGISDTEMVSYVKITGVELFLLDIHRTIVKDNLEIELYAP